MEANKAYDIILDELVKVQNTVMPAKAGIQ